MPKTKAVRQLTEGRHAAIYARVSGKSQAEDDKTSISEQIAEMESYCNGHGLSVVTSYREVGPGWSKNRPEFQRMLADARLGLFDTIVCWKGDRLTRGMYPAAALMEVVEAHQIHLRAVMDTIDMKTFGLMAAIGKMELDNFKERASMGKRGTAKQGRIPCNGVPYGYRIGEDGRPEVVDDQAEIVRRIFFQYTHEGLGIPAIAKQLMAEGVPTARSKTLWHWSHISRILRNEAYKGTWWYGKNRHVSTEGGRRIQEQAHDSWIPVPFPPLVDDEIWAQAQVLKSERLSRAKRNTKVFYMLQHLVRCTGCGMLMGGRATRQNTVRRNGRVYQYDLDKPRRYYHCYGMQKRLSHCREHPFIRAERLEELVWTEVKKILEDPQVILSGIEALKVSQDQEDQEAKRLNQLERDLRNVQTEEDRVIALYASGKISEDQLDRQRELIGAKAKHLNQALDEYHNQARNLAEKRAIAEKFTEWAHSIGPTLNVLSPEEMREVLVLLLDRVSIDGDNSVRITMAIHSGEFVAFEEPTSSCWSGP